MLILALLFYLEKEKTSYNIGYGFQIGLSNKDIKLIELLQKVLNKCTQNDMKILSQWLLKNCNSEFRAQLLGNFFNNITKLNYINLNEKLEEQINKKIYILYIINDILFISSRKNLNCIKKGLILKLEQIIKNTNSKTVKVTLKAPSNEIKQNKSSNATTRSTPVLAN